MCFVVNIQSQLSKCKHLAVPGDVHWCMASISGLEG